MVSDPAGGRALSGGKACGKDAGIALAGHPASAAQRGVPFLGQKAVPVSFGCYAGHKGLLFHAGLGSQSGGNVVQIPHLITLVGGEGGDHAVSPG